MFRLGHHLSGVYQRKLFCCMCLWTSVRKGLQTLIGFYSSITTPNSQPHTQLISLHWYWIISHSYDILPQYSLQKNSYSVWYLQCPECVSQIYMKNIYDTFVLKMSIFCFLGLKGEAWLLIINLKSWGKYVPSQSLEEFALPIGIVKYHFPHFFVCFVFVRFAQNF